MPDVVPIRAKWVGRAYLVEHGGVLTLVDTGTWMSEGRIAAALQRIGRRPTDIRQIVVSHSHGDHAGGASRLRELCEAPVIVGAADAPVIEGREPYRHAPAAWGRAAYGWLDRFPRYRPDRTIAAEEELEGGLHAIPAPGHTPGHLAFYAPQLRVLFTGDSVWNLGTVRLDWKSFCHDPERNVETVRRLAELPFDAAFVGHGPPIRRDARERLRSLIV